jgi:glycosidase
MAKWPNKPLIYQINTYIWLNSLSTKYQTPITLANVPAAELDMLGALGVDAVWLMGIWQRSDAARRSALNYVHEYKPVLPDLTEADVIGSAYAIGAYDLDARLGGRDGLAALRLQLQQRGLLLLLDFVPNHTATDHAWISQDPACYVQGGPRELKKRADTFFAVHDNWERPLVLAHGRDPYFPSWIDTAQLNAFAPAYRQRAIDTLNDIATLCDGVRCDMAMLMLNSVFEQTWGSVVGEADGPEFWQVVIEHVKQSYPDFIFIAEVYWGLEQRLQELGFDLTYDKALYDHVVSANIGQMKHHLSAAHEYQKRTVRFIENHDEPRAASHIGIAKSKAAAVLVCSTPGMTLLHDGQLTGRRIKLPMQIGRQPNETPNTDLQAFYHTLLREMRTPIYQRGTWTLFGCTAAEAGDLGHHHLVAYGWFDNTDYRLVIVNLTDRWSRAIVKVDAWTRLQQGAWSLVDVLGNARPIHFGGDHLLRHGVYVEVDGYGAHIYRLQRG